MATLAFLLAAFLDPVQAALVLVVALAYRGPLPILVAGATAALVAETFMLLVFADYPWGQWIAPRLVAALWQAVILCWVAASLRHHVGRFVKRGAGRSQAGLPRPHQSRV
jgi:hypothetical protein